jgi:sugar lactone lactonase YvrE
MLAVTLLATAALVAAPPFPETFPVPAGSQPEGIASGRGTTLYVGSRADGSVYRADARTGAGEVLVPGQDGRAAFGLKQADDELFVAGGPTGFGYIYDARSGRNVDAHDFDGGFVNDVTVTRRAAYFTDSVKPFIYVFPRGRHAAEPFALPITGDFVYGPGFNANGIAATKDGRTLILVQSSTGKLFAADAKTGVTRLIDAPLVPNGDGLLLRGKTLYAVQNQLNEIAAIRLDRKLRRGTLEAELTDPDFDIPTTVAALGHRLYAINARFNTPPTPTTTYDVVRVG